MKSKALALYSGIVGLVGGIYLLIAPFLLLAAVVSTQNRHTRASRRDSL